MLSDKETCVDSLSIGVVTDVRLCVYAAVIFNAVVVVRLLPGVDAEEVGVDEETTYDELKKDDEETVFAGVEALKTLAIVLVVDDRPVVTLAATVVVVVVEVVIAERVVVVVVVVVVEDAMAAATCEKTS